MVYSSSRKHQEELGYSRKHRAGRDFEMQYNQRAGLFDKTLLEGILKWSIISELGYPLEGILK